MTNKNWCCPHCLQHATIGKFDTYEKVESFSDHIKSDLSYILTAIACPNSSCGKLNLTIRVHENTSKICPVDSEHHVNLLNNNEEKMDVFWTLLPSSNVKKFPKYIPLAIRQDYEEACKIIDLSPKSSATLARRCLQTIIRDFWDIKNKKNLYDEIDALSTTINAELLDAFHDLRNIGNIGAHMEKDVNLIIDVEPDEAKKLIKFIENLIGLTYIERYNREQLLKKINTISTKKTRKRQNK